MTDLTKLTKEQLIEIIGFASDSRPFHVHSDGGTCRSPYCLSLNDPTPPVELQMLSLEQRARARESLDA